MNNSNGTLRLLQRVLGAMLTATLLWLAGAASADAQTLKVIVRDPGEFGSLGFTGVAPFDASSGPGRDAAATDHAVRTRDVVQYDWNYSVNGGAASNVTFTSTLPSNAACVASGICAVWQALPPQCGAGSSVSADLQTLVCAIGSVSSGSSASVNPTMKVLLTAPNGLTITPVVTMSGTDGGGAPVAPSNASGYSLNDSTASPTPFDTVSAAPAYDLEKVNGGSQYSLTGQGSGPGWFVIDYITIRAAGGTNTGFGAAQLSSPITFTDTLSGPVSGKLDGCGPTEVPTGSLGAQGGAPIGFNLPGSSGGGDYNKVVNSGSWICAQSGGPGTPITVSISGASTLVDRFYPSVNKLSQPVAPGYVVVGYIATFYSLADVNALPSHTAQVDDLLSTMVATSTSGVANVDPVPGNNTQSTTLDVAQALAANQMYAQKRYTNGSSFTPLPGQNVVGDGVAIVVPGQQIYSFLGIGNTGPQPYANAIVCDKIDTAHVIVRDQSPGIAVFYGVGASSRTPIVQYAASATLPDAQHATCGVAGDDVTDGPWFNTTTAVPGGNAAITKVRIIDNTDPINGILSAALALTVKAGVPNDTTIPNWMSTISPTSPISGWIHGTGQIGATYAAPFSCADSYCDRVTVMNEVARIVKETVPAGVRTVGAGQTMTFSLAPTLTSALASPAPSHVTIVDTMPSGMSYVAGSASLAPSSVVVNGDGTTTITWNLGTITPNAAIAPITMNAYVSSLIANNEYLPNVAVISSDLDKSDLVARTSTIYMQVSNPGGVSVLKTITSPTPHVNDPISYLLTYNNTGNVAISSTDFIDVLPAAANSPASVFAGTLSLSSLTAANGENLFYTTAAPTTINADPDCQSNGGITVGASCTANTVSGSIPDMTVVYTGLPTAVSPNANVTGLLICSNVGAAALNAAGATCVPGPGVTLTGPCTASAGSVASLPRGATLTCPISTTAPANGVLTLTGTTSATNETNLSNNNTSVTIPVIDAVNDPVVTLPSSGGSIPLYGNDTLGVPAVSPAQVTPSMTNLGGLPAGTTIDPTNGNLVVPSGVANGTYTVTYQICTRAPGTVACDTATVGVLVLGSDMVPSFSGLPTAAAPGAAVTGVLTCTNNGPGVATNASCALPTGGNLGLCTVAGVTATLPVALLPNGGAIVCAVSAIAPTSGILNLIGTTGATNDTNGGTTTGGNNSTPASLPVIDAVNDPQVTLPASGGNVPLYGNDTLGGNPVVPAQVTPSIVNLGGLPPTTTIDPATGNLVVPSDVPSGRYTVTYQICTKAPGTVACDSATAIVLIQGAPDLTVRKTHAPATFTERNPGSYRIVASNAGALATSGAYVIVDTLPAGMTVAALPTGNGWNCSATVIGSNRSSCTSSTTIAPGADNANAITMTVNVAAGVCASPDATGVCSGGSFVNNVTVSGGGEPPNATGNDSFGDPTPIQQAAAVTGQVWLDLNHDRVFNAGDLPKNGFVVEVLRNGAVQGTGTTDASGNYAVTGLVPGSGYSVRFKDPATGAYYGRPLSKDPAGGNDPTAAPSNGVVSGGEIQNLTLGYTPASGSTVRTNQSLPLDPNGVVYDSITRAPLGGATVALLNADGSAVPVNCIVGGANTVRTSVGVPGDVDGGYSFVLMNPVPAGCAGAADYRLRVTPPAGYALSTLIPAQTATLRAPANCLGSIAGLCVVQQQSGPPQAGQPTPYYLNVHLDPVLGPDVVNDHIPLDPAVPAGLVIAKTGDRTTVELGDSLRYAITIQRSDHGSNTLAAVEVIDTLPAGFRYIAGTAMVGKMRINDPVGAPGSVLRFQVGSLMAGGQVTLYYRVRAGVGSLEGSGINRARASIGSGVNCSARPAECSNEARYRVTVTGGVFTTDGCIVGRVFVDANNNHVKDPEELGIPGVRLYMQDGTSITTDIEGKYSRCGLAPHTHVLVVDPTTLPRGSRLTTSSSRNAGDAGSLFVDLKNGSLQRADFIEGSASNRVIEQVKARRTQGETNAPATEKKGSPPLKFVGKPLTAPDQATDSADQRAVKPRDAQIQPQADR